MANWYARDVVKVAGEWNARDMTTLPSTGGLIKYWTGSVWTEKPVKYWTGAAWVEKPLKRWTGSAWTLT